MDATTLILFLIALVIMLIGLIGTILPLIPGTPLILITAALFGWITGFDLVTGKTLGILAVLTGLALLLDWVASAVGVKRFGGSWFGMIGAVVGMLIGLWIPGGGLVGLIVGAFAGAVLGELLIGKNLRTALAAGIGSLAGFLVGVVGRFAIAATMIGIFIWATVSG